MAKLKKLVIKPHTPGRDVLYAALLVVLLMVAAYVHYGREQQALLDQQSQLRQSAQWLTTQHASLNQANGTLRERVAVLERALQIETESQQAVDRHLRDLQDEILVLREEVAFYRSIVAADGDSDLNIQAFNLREDAAGGYYFQLVLTRNMQNNGVIKGTVDLQVEGEKNGQSATLGLRDLGDSKSVGLAFEFKHFQRLQGRLNLPTDFVPRQISIQAKTTGGRAKGAKKTIQWQGAFS